MRAFDGRVAGSTAYIEVELVTDLTDREEEVRTSTQVDVVLPNRKLMRLPISWLLAEEDSPAEVLDSMLDASDEEPESKPTPKKAVAKRVVT